MADLIPITREAWEKVCNWFHLVVRPEDFGLRVVDGVVVPSNRMPRTQELPCNCYTAPDWEGCTCGNYGDARRQGLVQGWNECVEALSAAQKE